MKIAFTAKGLGWDSQMDPRFGRTEYFVFYDEDTKKTTGYDNREAGNDAHGAGPKTAQKLFELKADVLITGNGPGGNAAAVMGKTGIDMYIGAGDMIVKDAYEAYKNGTLTKL